jgi:hypothetical protein
LTSTVSMALFVSQRMIRQILPSNVFGHYSQPERLRVF